MTREWNGLLQARWDEGKFVCVGLDSDVGKLPASVRADSPAQRQLTFNKAIVDATKDLVWGYKPNMAFYEAQGPEGIECLRNTIAYIHLQAPGALVTLDAKRADIGNTNDGYAEAIFDYLGADAVTVHPYLGGEALAPFLRRSEKGVIVLCRTSNPGAPEFQDLMVNSPDLGSAPVPLYQHVAHQVANDWNTNGNCAVVVGATYPDELGQVRHIVGDMPILLPGIGAQGGDLEATVKSGANSRGQGMIINNARGIIFASSGEDFAEVARAKTVEMNESIQAVLAAA